MGLFDFLKKKPEAPAVSVKIEARQVEEEVKQRTPGELPMADVSGYVSPSGGFVNYGRFRVSGTNASTGRKNTKRYEVQDEAAARAAAIADGLSDPLEVSVEPSAEPSDRQVDYVAHIKSTQSSAAIPPPAGLTGSFLSSSIFMVLYCAAAAPAHPLSLYDHGGSA